MKAATATARRPNRVLLILAAAWMAISLAIGGMAAQGPVAEQGQAADAVADRVQP